MRLFIAFLISFSLPSATWAQTCESHPWSTPISAKNNLSQGVPAIKTENPVEIAKDLKLPALELLKAKQFVRLSNAQAQSLGILDQQGELEDIYLVRALRYPNEGGIFKVYKVESNISILFAFLGPTGGPAEPTVLAIKLSSMPKHLYLACEGAM
jgi:hypothetical protein